MVAPQPSGTVTFLFTDIEGSAVLAQQRPEQLPALLTRHDAILRQSIEANNGTIFRTIGDAFCSAFNTAGEALRSALEGQRRLQRADWGPAVVKVRMGIHTGPAQPLGTGDYSGYLTLTRVQRIMSVAHGGQVLVSGASAELLRGDLPEGVQLRDMGEHRLKGLLNLEQIWQISAPGLLSEFPPLLSLNATPGNLPVQLTSFIGREREVTEAVRLLKVTRLLTLTGVGGVGKTRLALQVGAETLGEFKEGAWFVELAPLADPELVLQHVAGALGLKDTPGRPMSDTLVDYLRAKELLLLFDNCEHLLTACADLADRLLRACPQLRILASSREALGIAGETILQVPSLSLPDLQRLPSAENLARFEAVQLFLERARQVQPGFAITTQNAQAVAQICRRLDGIPLAIELAAARVKMFSPEQILERLGDRFRLLTGGSRTALPRQQALRALIDWSYDLLPEEERIFLRRLSVFSGGWSFEAGEGVAGQDGPLSFETLDLLTHLIDKSLVMVEESGGDEPARYRFLETIRQYAGEKLVESGESSAVRDRHLDFFDRFAQTADSNLHSQEQPRWLDRIELEHDNLRTALAWALEKDPEAAVRLAGAMSYFWIIRGYTDEARGWLARLLERMNGLPSKETSGMAARARLLFGYGWVLFAQGDNPGARSALRESAALARQVGDWHLLARVLNRLGMAEAFLGDVAAKVSAEESADLSRKAGDYWELAMAFGALANYALMQGNLRLAQGYLEESDKYFNQIGDPWNSAMALLGSAIALTRMGNFPEAKARLEKSLELFQKIGEKTQVNMARSELAHIERRQGNYEQAALLYRTTLPAWQNLGRREAVAHQLESIAFIAAAQGSYDQAAQLLGAAEALRDLIQIPMTPMEREEYDRNLADLRSHMEEQSFAAGWAKGRSMTMDEAIVCALELIG